MMRLTCPLCEEKKETYFLARYRGKNHPFIDRNLYECLSCNLIFISPMPTEDELDSYYQQVWLKDKALVANNSDSDLVYSLQADERVRYISRHIDVSQDDFKVLDIGSGYGRLYDSFCRFREKKTIFYATDLCRDNVIRLKNKGLPAFATPDEISEKDFDLITICFTLEHVPNPVEFLTGISQYLKKGGVVYLDVPERDDSFKDILEPHVAVYTKSSLTKLAEQSGLSLLHTAGYGRKRRWLIDELNNRINPAIIIDKCLNKSRQFFDKIIFLNNLKEQKKRTLYRYYKFNQEGRNRWWRRIILQKK